MPLGDIHRELSEQTNIQCNKNHCKFIDITKMLMTA